LVVVPLSDATPVQLKALVPATRHSMTVVERHPEKISGVVRREPRIGGT
jgi:hypothetical protein